MRSSNITLSTSFGRRFRKHDTSPQRTLDRAVVDQLPDDVAAFLAAGGKIDRLPGFAEIAPRAAITSPATPDEDPAQWRQAPDLPGYLVNRGGRVWCRASKNFVTPRGNSRVQVTKKGKFTWVNSKDLAEIAWGDQNARQTPYF